MTDNREAGMLVESTENSNIISFFRSVFEYDFNHGTKWPIDPSQFSQQELDVIADKTEIPVPKYPNSTSKCSFNPHDLTVRDSSKIMALTMPAVSISPNV